jgi:hypothetical protein
MKICEYNYSIKRYHFLLLIFLLPIFTLPSCKSKKTTKTREHTDNTSTIDVSTKNEFFDNTIASVATKQLQFNNLSLRCKVVYDDGKIKQDFTANIRIKKDSIIWVSLTGIFGIEGARLVVTKDSVLLLNKLTREYLARPISYLSQLIPLSSGYDALQNLLIGQLINIEPAEHRIYEADSLLVLNFQNSNLRQTATVHRQNYTTLDLLLADQLIKQDLKITFGDYRNLSGSAFSFLRFIEVNRGLQKMKINLEVQRYTINEQLTFPLDINGSYKRI